MGLIANGEFSAKVNAEELGAILRNLVYTMFADHKVAGHNFGLVHNVPAMNVEINNHEAQVSFVVHIHKPIVAFLEFRYVLANDPAGRPGRIGLKKGTLKVEEKTRRLDLKAKAALAAIDVEGIARRELTDIPSIIVSTLPPQLARLGVVGTINTVELGFNSNYMDLRLEGTFVPIGQMGDGSAPLVSPRDRRTR
jgi:hypothetical protein